MTVKVLAAIADRQGRRLTDRKTEKKERLTDLEGEENVDTVRERPKKERESLEPDWRLWSQSKCWQP